MRTTLRAREASIRFRLLGGCGMGSGIRLLTLVLGDGPVEGRCAEFVHSGKIGIAI